MEERGGRRKKTKGRTTVVFASNNATSKHITPLYAACPLLFLFLSPLSLPLPPSHSGIEPTMDPKHIKRVLQVPSIHPSDNNTILFSFLLLPSSPFKKGSDMELAR